MYEMERVMNPSPELALSITEEEADALMSVLLNAPPSEEIPEALAQRLLCRLAEIQRAFTRRCPGDTVLCTPTLSVPAAAYSWDKPFTLPQD